MLEKNRKMVYKVTEGMKLEGTWLLEPTRRGTKLTATIEYNPPVWIFVFFLDKLKIEKRDEKDIHRKPRKIEEDPRRARITKVTSSKVE
jgi:hypothetical protein